MGEAFGIKIYGRIKPIKQAYPGIEISSTEGHEDQISFALPKNEADGLVNNRKELFNFRFTHMFPDTTTQEEIFDVVAKPVVERWEDGDR